jgi:phage host-nuclease inhibitor protein Gam
VTSLKKSKPVKAPASAASVPQTKEEAAQAIAKIGEAQRARQVLESRMNEQIASIKEYYEELAQVHNEVIKSRSAGLQMFCEANRLQLTQMGKVKFASFTTGEVKWRTTPPKVTVRAAEAVLEMFRRFGMERFIRVKEEVNKEAILAEAGAAETIAAAGIAGVVISQAEEFVIEPFETKLEEVV